MGVGVLVLNAGSSSIKFALYEEAGGEPRLLQRGAVSGIGSRARFHALVAGAKAADEALEAEGARAFTHDDALARILAWLRAQRPPVALAAAGHRVVHGGDRFAEPALVDDEALAYLRTLVPLAPLHQPHCLAAIESLGRRDPDLPQVACFDTAFHQAQPLLAREFGLPRVLTETGIRRYGFHGLNYEAVAAQLPRHLGEGADGRVIVAHLGNGASLCALRDRRSVATTMGLTPLDGLVMSTRCGAIDPGVLLYLLQVEEMDPASLAHLLYHESGLLGVSGKSGDMATLLASGDAPSREAVDLFVYRVRREIGSLAAALGGLDALVFTGGIGENAPSIRERVCADAAWLGVRLDPALNRSGGPRISPAGSAVSAWVLPAREDDVIVRRTLERLAVAAPAS